MFILKIIKTNGKNEEGQFKTYQECIDHFEKYKAEGYWGKEEYTITHPSHTIHHDEIVEVIGQEAADEVPAVLNKNGEIITPAIPAKKLIEAVAPVAAYDEIIPAWDEVIPAEYTYVIEDHTAEVEQAKLNDESLKYLAETDWLVVRYMETGIEIPPYIKTTRQMARNNIVR